MCHDKECNAHGTNGKKCNFFKGLTNLLLNLHTKNNPTSKKKKGFLLIKINKMTSFKLAVKMTNS